MNLENEAALVHLPTACREGALLCIGNFLFPFDTKGYEQERQRLYSLVDDICDRCTLFDNPFHNHKLTVKLQFFMDSPNHVCYEWLFDFLDYCNIRHVAVGFGTMLKDDLAIETATIVRLNAEGYTNIIATVACYRTEASDLVDLYLKLGVCIRLVKGYYRDRDVPLWTQVTGTFYENAMKLKHSGKYHILATHDYDLLLDVYRHGDAQHLEISHFWHARWYVLQKKKEFPFRIAKLSYYIPIGKRQSTFLFWCRHVNWSREISDILFSMWYLFRSKL